MRLQSLCGFLCSALLLAFSALPAAAQGRRIALVIGNSDYRSVDRLINPINDAKLIAATLKQSGFVLVGDGPQLDLDKAHFDRAVQAFGRALPGADVALFYYSGHGMQVEGVNWLVPVDARPTGPRDLDFQMVDASLVLKQMEGAGTKLNMLILDACRNNPFAVRGVRGTQTGLAEMHAPEGTLISYATQPGNVAADGSTGDSPYTAALVNAMRRPGADVFQVFNQTGLQVKAATAGQQQPWFAASPLSGNFFFFNGPVTIQQAAPADPETVYWSSIASSRDPADYHSYLQRYPRGMFADLAQRRYASLTVPQPAPAAPPSTNRIGSEQTLRRATVAGQQVRIFTYSRWNSACSASDPPQIAVRTPPAHGTVTIRPGDVTVSVIRIGMPDCTGHTFPGTAIWYTPQPDFHGVDQFTYDVVGRTDAPHHDTAVVDVR